MASVFFHGEERIYLPYILSPKFIQLFFDVMIIFSFRGAFGVKGKGGVIYLYLDFNLKIYRLAIFYFLSSASIQH